MRGSRRRSESPAGTPATCNDRIALSGLQRICYMAAMISI